MKHFPKVDRICQAIKAKYEYANEEYIVVAPNGVLDIITFEKNTRKKGKSMVP